MVVTNIRYGDNPSVKSICWILFQIHFSFAHPTWVSILSPQRCHQCFNSKVRSTCDDGFSLRALAVTRLLELFSRPYTRSLPVPTPPPNPPCIPCVSVTVIASRCALKSHSMRMETIFLCLDATVT